MNFAEYDFIKIHGALEMTPAKAAPIEKNHWTVEEPVKRRGE